MTLPATYALRALISVCFLASSFAADEKLPPSAEALLLKRLRAYSVASVRDLRQRRIGSFDYLGFAGSFGIMWGFEGMYHPLVVIRKKHTAPDWSRAELFIVHAPHIPTLFDSSERDFRRALTPWP